MPVNAAPPRKEPVTLITGRFPGGERSLSPEKIDRRFKERIPRTAVELGEFIRFHGTSKRGIAYDLHLTIIDFDSTRHRIRREREYGFVEKIDGRRPYGVDGDMPDTEFGRFEITIDGKRLKIPRTAYSDLFQPRFYADFIEAFESRDGRRLYLQMSASDGAGAYTVTWAFDHERYLSREISDEC
jgi:hypothetical protein